ncbi:MAG TPA: aminofutalosine synthase MqnE [Bacteroidia bacterium]|nr:aminofutalosine synthase MqnE [Bacteroidia bacterium]
MTTNNIPVSEQIDSKKFLILSHPYYKQYQEIIDKILNLQRISDDDALTLYNMHDLSYLSLLADYVNLLKNKNIVYYNRNIHIEPTNLCVYSCAFCSYSRLIKQRDEGWQYTIDDIMNILKKYDHQSITEVHITGGVIPQQDLNFYIDLFKSIKSHRPEIHIKALTPVEIHYISKKAKLTYDKALQLLSDAGLDSMPGGGAEIFNKEIREKIAGGKCTTEQWLEIHRIWHKMGKKSNATMLYGHIETYEHRVEHMRLLRDLQDETNGFQAFIPLKFRNKNNAMSNVPEVSIIEDMKNYAVARLYLDNFPHIKAYWAMLGRHNAQMALHFGADDLDGTIDDTTKIYSMAGSEEQHPTMTTEEIKQLIIQAHKTPLERDTLYQPIKAEMPS